MSNAAGTIVKASGGFYTVETDTVTVECRARGIFRKDGIKPCVGDNVGISVNADGSGSVDEILKRKNYLIRPPLANLDSMALVISVLDPPPNLFVTDKLITVVEHSGIEPVIVVTKSDLRDASPLAELYASAGFAVFQASAKTGEGIPEFKRSLTGKFSAFSGNSGVGKTSLLNAIDSRLGLEVAETSKKLGRGRHTTRTVQIYTLDNGGRVADTPGFSSIDPVLVSNIDRDTLPLRFREFAEHTRRCRFDDCTHTVEAGCGVLKAVRDGKIAESRHKSYMLMFEQIKDMKEWERPTK